MNDESLRQLLQRADAAIPQPAMTTSPAALLAAVRRRRRRSAGLRVATVTALLATTSIAALRTSDHTPPPPSDRALRQPVNATNADALRRDLARLEQEAQQHAHIAQAVLSAVAAPIESTASQPWMNDADLVRIESARTAAITWQYASTVETDRGDPVAARREYQRITERFPGTKWAQLAVTSLERLAEPAETSL